MQSHPESHKPEFFYFIKCNFCGYSTSMKVKDEFENAHEFEELLSDADGMAHTPWEKEFVQNIREKYEDMDIETHYSESQLNILTKIASRVR